MNRSQVPSGMSRRHFLAHLAGASAMALPAWQFTRAIAASAADLKKQGKSCILLWLGGGPSTIDMWDMKPGAATGGPFKPISTTSEAQICEHLPLVAKEMKHLSIVRSMSTREADHSRGRYYLHTGFAPDPTIDHPSYGAVVAKELASSHPQLEIPPFVAVGNGPIGAGFLGMTWAPFVVGPNGNVPNLRSPIETERLDQRMQMLAAIERNFVTQITGELDPTRPTKITLATDHAKVLEKARTIMTSKQLETFRVDKEPDEVQERYGKTNLGRGCLMARRLVEFGIPFVEVDFEGWDNHQQVFDTLQKQRLPELDKAMSALVSDLHERGLLANTAVLCMGEFGRTPRINGNAGRDHWARGWSAVVGGAGFKPGLVVGKTNADGTEVESEPYSSQDLMASTLKALGISLDITYQARNGRPLKIANSGKLIKELFA